MSTPTWGEEVLIPIDLGCSYRDQQSLTFHTAGHTKRSLCLTPPIQVAKLRTKTAPQMVQRHPGPYFPNNNATLYVSVRSDAASSYAGHYL